jgi:hypothetical protein
MASKDHEVWIGLARRSTTPSKRLASKDLGKAPKRSRGTLRTPARAAHDLFLGDAARRGLTRQRRET